MSLVVLQALVKKARQEHTPLGKVLNRPVHRGRKLTLYVVFERTGCVYGTKY